MGANDMRVHVLRNLCLGFSLFCMIHIPQLTSLSIQSWTKDYDLDRIMQYAMRHNVPQLTITCLNRTFN